MLCSACIKTVSATSGRRYRWHVVVDYDGVETGCGGEMAAMGRDAAVVTHHGEVAAMGYGAAVVTHHGEVAAVGYGAAVVTRHGEVVAMGYGAAVAVHRHAAADCGHAWGWLAVVLAAHLP